MTPEARPRVVIGAQACGFGPVAKLLAITRETREFDRVLVACGSTLEFARLHPECFDELVCYDEGTLELESAVGAFDLALVVMNHDLAIQAARMERPLHFFDSLFGFWIVRRRLDEIRRIADGIRGLSFHEAMALVEPLSPHERKALCHALATVSYVQNFRGVEERVQEWQRAGLGPFRIVGPIVGAHCTEVGARVRRSMVVNLGGVENFVIKYHENDHAIDLVLRWVSRFLENQPDAWHVILCCGRFRTPETRRIGSSTVECRLLPNREFTRAASTAEVFVSAAGLTALAEASRFRRVPVLLPEQHFSQHHNLEMLEGTGLRRFSVRLHDVVPSLRVPHHDLRGSEAIIEATGDVLRNGALEDRFHRLMAERIEAVRRLDGRESAAIVGAMNEWFRGAPVIPAFKESICGGRVHDGGFAG